MLRVGSTGMAIRDTDDPALDGRTPGNLDLLLLGVLAREPLHGYAIIASLGELSGGLFDLNEGRVYPALHRLERTGLLESVWGDTRGGRRALDAERAAWRRTVDAVSAVIGSSPARAGRRS